MSRPPFSAVPDAASPGARQAALLLHGVGEADRQWLLKELSAIQRNRLDALLGELRTLGLPPSPGLIDDILGAGKAPEVAEKKELDAAAPPDRALADRLSRLAPATIAGALQAEPDALVARVLRIASDRQRRAVIRQAGPSRRQCLDECARTAEPRGDTGGDRLQLAILDALLRRTGEVTHGTGLRAAVARCLAAAQRPAKADRLRSHASRP